MSYYRSLTITKPDDWHLHIRDGDMLRQVVPHSAKRFARAIVMPNLTSPITTTDLAIQYRQRILAAIPQELGFEPLMTLFLTEATTPDEIAKAQTSKVVHAVKWYPAGATTNSETGVREIARCYPVLEAMEELGMPLLVHAESTDPNIDIYDREAVFIDRQLTPVIRRFPSLRVVVEHVTTTNGVQFVRDSTHAIAGTITAHHLLLNRNALFDGGLRPHHYCRPVLKRESHRLSLIEAAISGNPRFFLGSDSAPHTRQAKEAACGCAGVYTAHAAIELYTEVFDQADAIDRLEPFASFFGADFYGLPRNQERITLEKKTWYVPESFGSDLNNVVPLRAGESVGWQLAEVQSTVAKERNVVEKTSLGASKK